MAANPLTFVEMEAFERKALISFSAWEADLIMRIDDTILDVFARNAPKSSGKTKATDEPEGIPINDGKSLKGLLRGFVRGRHAT